MRRRRRDNELERARADQPQHPLDRHARQAVVRARNVAAACDVGAARCQRTRAAPEFERATRSYRARTTDREGALGRAHSDHAGQRHPNHAGDSRREGGSPHPGADPLRVASGVRARRLREGALDDRYARVPRRRTAAVSRVHGTTGTSSADAPLRAHRVRSARARDCGRVRPHRAGPDHAPEPRAAQHAAGRSHAAHEAASRDPAAADEGRSGSGHRRRLRGVPHPRQRPRCPRRPGHAPARLEGGLEGGARPALTARPGAAD